MKYLLAVLLLIPTLACADLIEKDGKVYQLGAEVNEVIAQAELKLAQGRLAEAQYQLGIAQEAVDKLQAEADVATQVNSGKTLEQAVAVVSGVPLKAIAVPVKIEIDGHNYN